MPRVLQQLHTALDGVTASVSVANAQPIPMKGVRKATWFFTRADDATGASAFVVSVSADDTTYVTFAKLIDNVTNTNAQHLTRVAGKTITNEDATYTLSMDLTNDSFSSMKCL